MAAILLAAKRRRLALMDMEKEDEAAQITPEKAEWNFTPDSLMGTMPSKDDVILDAVLGKLNSELQWTERRVAFTKDTLFFAAPEDTCIKDCVPLYEVKHVCLNRKKLRQEAVSDGVGEGEGPEEEAGVGSLKRSQSAKAESVDEDEEGEMLQTANFSFEVCTVQGGYNSGRTYYFKCETKAECDAWIKGLKTYVKDAQIRKIEAESSKFRVYQRKALDVYNSDTCQGFVALLITANFIVNVSQAEMQPHPFSHSQRVYDFLDVMFTCLFVAELCVNMFANWMIPFFSDSWNNFDLLVVIVSVLALAFEEIPGLSTLRLMRAFRVLRLFGRLSSLRQIINALTAAIIPVLNAFFIMLLVTSIYSILAVSFFGELDPRLFGTFFRSLFTMFQVCTGDNWSDVARELFTLQQEKESREAATVNGTLSVDYIPPIYSGRIYNTTALFFVSFQVIVAWTLLQVVVAVMLENFGSASDREKEKQRKDKADATGRIVPHYALDPLLASLAHFNTSGDLSTRIGSLFQVLDMDDSMTLSYMELSEGLKKLKVKPMIYLSEEDFDAITCGRELCNEEGQITYESFERIMKIQLKLYVQRQMANAMELADRSGSQSSTVLFVLKQLIIKLDDMTDDRYEPQIHIRNPQIAWQSSVFEHPQCTFTHRRNRHSHQDSYTKPRHSTHALRHCPPHPKPDGGKHGVTHGSKP
uniref:PH domain-containing protein n=3 Tax=Hemiselmis andersenii TaxID=464988 RepID=A0A6U5CI52_HEMAN|mmetsp:Transcript_7981/g.19557  ORF Transcript_7981/g.19557 Transcript_7981/m.19557 type:complete len:699 (+) Transcript_7981:300-2396(+)